jgi:hypothetical protein
VLVGWRPCKLPSAMPQVAVRSAAFEAETTVPVGGQAQVEADGLAVAVGARALIDLAKTSQCSGRAGTLRFAAFGGLSVAEVGAVDGLGSDLSVVRSAQLMAAEATTVLSDIGVDGRVNHQISSLAVLSPNLSWCTFSLSSNASIRLDIWVCGANFKCRPPCNCPLAPPATTMGSGS